MALVRLTKYRTSPPQFAQVDTDATVGARIGVDLLMPDGTIATTAKLAALFGTVTGGSQTLNTTDDLQEGQWNLWFKNRRAQDAVGGILADSANVTLAYVGGTSIKADLTELPNAGGGALLRFVRDAWGRVTGTSTPTTTDLAEGTNLYYTDARAAAAAPVQSVAGKTGAVTLAKADVGLGNVDNTSDVNKPVSTAQQAALDALLPPSYIDGLQLQWVSGTALTVTSGAAYIQSSAKVLRAPSAIAKTGLSLAASTWYHVYLYSNAGTPDVEIVTTAPAVAYNGTARSKTGDTSRRYVGSVKTDSSGNITNFLQSGTTVSYVAPVGSGNPPFRILSGGTATSLTTVSASGIIPVTATLAQASFTDTATSGGLLCVSPGNYIGSSGVIALNHASKMNSLASTDGSQAFVYQYVGASSGGAAYIDVFGYVFER